MLLFSHEDAILISSDAATSSGNYNATENTTVNLSNYDIYNSVYWATKADLQFHRLRQP